MKTAVRLIAGALAPLAAIVGVADAQGPTTGPGRPVRERPHLRRHAPTGCRRRRTCWSSATSSRRSPPAPIADAGRRAGDADRGRRPHADAGADRRPHPHHVRDRAAGGGADQRHRLRQRRRRQGRQRHADARLHQRPRPRRPGVRPEARHRHRAGARAAHLARRAPSSRRPAATATSACRTTCRRAPGDFTYSERVGAAAIADSADTVRQRAREQLALGASQIKLMAGGGVASSYDPLDVTQYTVARAARRRRGGRELGHLRHRARLHAAGGAPGDRGRREVHRPRPAARRATAKLMAEKGIWWSLQPFVDDGPSPSRKARRTA